jgi:hypothetical protein
VPIARTERTPLRGGRHRTPGTPSGSYAVASTQEWSATVCSILLAMLAADAYRPDQWHDFFLMVGGAAAALTGLVFVALSLDLGVVMSDATHRYRAIGTLTNFAGIFVVCALALMGGQNHVAIGTEWLVVSSTAGAVYVTGYLRARTSGGSQTTLSVLRTVSGTGFYGAQVVGSIVLLAGATAGLYIAAVAMVVLAAYSVSGAWLLLVGVQQDEDRRTQ